MGWPTFLGREATGDIHGVQDVALEVGVDDVGNGETAASRNLAIHPGEICPAQLDEAVLVSGLRQIGAPESEGVRGAHAIWPFVLGLSGKIDAAAAGASQLAVSPGLT
jgi:hypothetical protein